jgi:copper chaperone CopZ
MWKLIRTTLLGFSLLFASFAVQAKPMTYELTVDGLACPFCAYGIEKKLGAIEGVTGIDVDINKGVVRVTMAEGAKLPEPAARKAVKSAGFTLRRFASPGGAK